MSRRTARASEPVEIDPEIARLSALGVYPALTDLPWNYLNPIGESELDALIRGDVPDRVRWMCRRVRDGS